MFIFPIGEVILIKNQIKAQKILRFIFGPTFSVIILLIFAISIGGYLYFSFRHGISFNANYILAIITGLYATLTYYLVSASIATQRGNTLNWINSFLAVDEPGKTLLFSIFFRINLRDVTGDPQRMKDLNALVAKLNRVASAAVHATALEELLELHWDWYYYLYSKYENLMRDIMNEKLKTFLSMRGRVWHGIDRDDAVRVWVYYLYAIKEEVDIYAERRTHTNRD